MTDSFLSRALLSTSLAMGLLLAGAVPAMAAEGKLKLEKLDDRVRVEIDGQLFTEYIFQGYDKPILYPVMGPGQTPMTRNYPMKQDVQGEASDHPHHKSIWCAHGDVNGIDFWSEKGRIEHVRFTKIDADLPQPRLVAENRWLDGEGREVATDTTTITFLTVPGGRAIDYQVDVHASAGDITFGDTKEGMMAVRTHPNLRLDNDARRGVTTANGQSVNSEGVEGKPMWGKRAAWVDYWGTINERQVGIAIFDHPENLRHPTTWHARSYGLVAANLFGLHHFEGKQKGEGDFTVKSGDDVTFRYRIVLHEGDAKQAKVAELYGDFAGAPE